MNRKRFWKTPKNAYILLGVLAGLSAILYVTYLLTEQNSKEQIIAGDTTSVTLPSVEKTNPESRLNGAIDSILYTFGIKQEWITTEKPKAQKKAASRAVWFTKVVLIPKDLASAEINLDISTYLNEAGLSSRVNEEIISKDIAIYVNHPDSTQQLPAAIIQIIHSEKVKRTDVTVAIILDKVSEFSESDLDKLMISRNEFSYVFPRNLDDIDVQHKLLQHKKDVLINLTIGGKDNYEADFNTLLDEKGIREKVRNFNADFSTINKVLLTKAEGEAGLNLLQKKITEELGKYNIITINDTMLTPVYDSGEDDKIGTFFKDLVQKSASNKNIITIYPVDKSEFAEFYRHVLILKKLGYKFINLSEFVNYVKEQNKKEQELLEKQKQEQLKKKMQEELKKKKNPKVPPMKDTKKKTGKKN